MYRKYSFLRLFFKVFVLIMFLSLIIENTFAISNAENLIKKTFKAEK